MDALLLETKLQIPRPYHQGLTRTRLLDALETGIPRHKFGLISAPAGYGKTTLMAQWARSSRHRVVWLSMDARDNDAERFLRYLVAGWKRIQPGINETPVGLLLSAMQPDLDAVLAAFINVGQQQSDHVVFVLDDYHVIEDAAVHNALAFLLDHCPPSLHVVLTCRGEPPLPIARYRAKNALLELHAGDLQFQMEETRALLADVLQREVTDSDVAYVQEQLEGWVAGLQLMVRKLQRHTSNQALVVSGKDRFIFDYLSHDVLASQPADVQQFLLQTSLLDGLCASLCDAVTDAQSGQMMLERLERENLFLMALDDRREWFRYHSLFGDFLKTELDRRDPDMALHGHGRAARWYFAHELPEQAFHHAVAARDAPLVVQIFNRYMNAKLLSGELAILKQWLDAVPLEWYAAYPVLNLGRAGFLAYTGAFEACVRCVDEVEQRLLPAESETARWQMARVTAVRCLMACTQNDLEQAQKYADRALTELSEDDIGFRPGIYAALGDTYRQHGRWEDARAAYLKVLDFAHAPAVQVRAIHVYGALADLSLRQGRLRDAEGYWQKALALTEDISNWGRLSLPVIGWVHIRIAEILYERDQRADAWQYLSRGLERAVLAGDVRAQIAGFVLATRHQLTEGNIEAALTYFDQASALIEQAPFAEWLSRFERVQVDLWHAQQRLRAAMHWADTMLETPDFWKRPDGEPAQLALVRTHLLQGDSAAIGRSLDMIEQLNQTAEAEGRAGVQIEAFTLAALAHWKTGHQTRAMTSLERALRLAEPEGYLRLFADLGPALVRVLQEAHRRSIFPDYTRRILAACSADVDGAVGDGAPLLDPLSAREQEILQLIAAGLTNREIAETLVISPETVKKHTGNIYSKLSAGSRTQAIARARDHGLLD